MNDNYDILADEVSVFPNARFTVRIHTWLRWYGTQSGRYPDSLDSRVITFGPSEKVISKGSCMRNLKSNLR